VIGSPSFIPPEQAAGKGELVGPASDVYSLGAILLSLGLTRAAAVCGGFPDGLAAHGGRRLSRFRHGCSMAAYRAMWETICLKCLRKEPARRYATARELVEDLRRFLADEPIQARPAPPAARIWRWCRKNRALAAAGAASACSS